VLQVDALLAGPVAVIGETGEPCVAPPASVMNSA
jgi:hypothetical protein